MPNEPESKQSTRRGFLSATMTALTAASYNRVLGANDRVGIGFIGFGLIGKQHIYNFKKSFPDVAYGWRGRAGSLGAASPARPRGGWPPRGRVQGG